MPVEVDILVDSGATISAVKANEQVYSLTSTFVTTVQIAYGRAHF